MYLLDKIDRKILVALGKNARLSNTQIGKAVGTSRDIVQYRIKKLEEKKIITKYVAHTRNHEFGIENYEVCLNVQNASPQKQNEITGKLKKISFVKLLFETRGAFDYVIVIGAKNKIHLAQLIEQINNCIGKKLLQQSVNIYVKVIKATPMSYLEEEIKLKNSKFKKIKDKKIDITDKKIIKFLSTNARAPIVDVAKHIGLSGQQTSRRILSLISAGMIKNPHALINTNKIGYVDTLVYFKFSHYSRKNELALFEIMSQFSKITFVERILGQWDIRCTITTKREENIDEIINTIRKTFYNDISSYAIVPVIKEALQRPYVGKI